MEAAATVLTGRYPFNRELAERIRRYISDTEKGSIDKVARAINYARPTLSRYLSGTYDSDPSGIEAALASFLREQTGEDIPLSSPEDRPGTRPQFFESRDARAVLGLCRSCQEHQGLGIVVGRSGYGKTYSLKEYAKLPRVAYLECDDTMSARDLVEEIEDVLGIPGGYGTIRKRANGVRDFFNTNQGYLLIVDEADKLVSKHTQKKMEILRSLFDKSRVGVVIAGELKLETQIKLYLERMANRVDFYVKLQGLSPSEVEGYLQGYAVTAEAMMELKARACNSQNGCFRLLDRTMNNVGRILGEAGRANVTMKTLEQASAMMML